MSVETDQRCQDHVETTRRDCREPVRAFGFVDAVPVARAARVLRRERHEAHRAATPAGDVRRIEAGPVRGARPGSVPRGRLRRRARGTARPVGRGRVRSEPAQRRRGSRARRASLLGRSATAAEPRNRRRSIHCVSGALRMRSVQEKGMAPPACAVTDHCSRHRAISRGRPRHLRLSARGGLAQCCRLSPVPWVFTYGREVTRTVSNTAGGAKS